MVAISSRTIKECLPEKKDVSRNLKKKKKNKENNPYTYVREGHSKQGKQQLLRP